MHVACVHVTCNQTALGRFFNASYYPAALFSQAGAGRLDGRGADRGGDTASQANGLGGQAERASYVGTVIPDICLRMITNPLDRSTHPTYSSLTPTRQEKDNAFQ